MLAWAQGGSLLASGHESGELRLFDAVGESEELALRTTGGSVTALVFSPDGMVLVCGDTNGRIEVRML